jgi:hypothetical protein
LARCRSERESDLGEIKDLFKLPLIIPLCDKLTNIAGFASFSSSLSSLLSSSSFSSSSRCGESSGGRDVRNEQHEALLLHANRTLRRLLKGFSRFARSLALEFTTLERVVKDFDLPEKKFDNPLLKLLELV